MSLSILLTRGGTAHLLVIDGDRAALSSPVASPPGSTLTGTVAGVSAELQLKVKSCKKEGDRFRIEGRLRNTTRELRDRLHQAASSIDATAPIDRTSPID